MFTSTAGTAGCLQFLLILFLFWPVLDEQGSISHASYFSGSTKGKKIRKEEYKLDSSLVKRRISIFVILKNESKPTVYVIGRPMNLKQQT